MDGDVEMEGHDDQNIENKEGNEYADDNNPDKEMENEEDGNGMMYIYEWVDKIQLSRSKKNMSRDFSDGVLLAEIIKTYLPRMVELHNYPSVNSTAKKIINWNTLNTKVLKEIGVKMTKAEINDIVTYKPNAIEKLLARVYDGIQNTTGISIANGETHKRPQRDGISNLKKTLEEKENNIKYLNDTVEVLEMKLKSSRDLEQTLESQVNELTELLKSKGVEV